MSRSCRKMLIALLLLGSLLLLACRSVPLEKHHTVQTYEWLGDSAWHLKAAVGRVSEERLLTKLVFSNPDSAGEQYLSAVEVGKVRAVREKRATEITEQKGERQTAAVAADQVFLKQGMRLGARPLILLLIGGLALLLLWRNR